MGKRPKVQSESRILFSVVPGVQGEPSSGALSQTKATVFPRNLAAPRIVAAFEISPRNSNAQCTKRRPQIPAACGKGSSLLLRAYVRMLY